MRRDFYIVWVDDEFAKQSYSLRDLVNEVNEYILDFGFYPNVKELNNFDEAMSYLGTHPKVDMFICDYNIGEIKGTDLFRDIRTKYKQDLILYSNIGKNEIKQEIISFLNQNISPEFFSRFTFTSLTDNDATIETIEKIIYLNIMKWQEINGLRGMVLAEVSQIHHNLLEKIRNSTGICSHLNYIYNNNILHDSRFSNSDISSYLQGHALGDMKFSLICNMLIPYNDSLFKTYKEIADLRNSLAHVKEDEDNNGCYLRSLKNNGCIIYEKDISNIRKKVLKFEDDLEAYLKTLPL